MLKTKDGRNTVINLNTKIGALVQQAKSQKLDEMGGCLNGCLNGTLSIQNLDEIGGYLNGEEIGGYLNGANT